MEISNVLIKPLLTEKTTMLKDEVNQVSFLVDMRANKMEVQQAVEMAFDVKVKAVNIVRRRPLKRKRQGKVAGRIAGHKKAYVMLAPGAKIDFEGV